MLGCLGMQVQRLSHIGICVTDLEASVAFYRDALGFSEISRLAVSGPESEQLLELKDVALRAVYLERDGTRIELLRFDSPGETGGPGPRPVNQTGLTHLSFRVASLDDAIAAVESRAERHHQIRDRGAVEQVAQRGVRGLGARCCRAEKCLF